MSKSFVEIVEAKKEKQLFMMAPKPEGEQNFVKLERISSVSDKFLDPNNGVFDVAKKVKEFARKQNRFGRNEDESVADYDKRVEGSQTSESVSLSDRYSNAHKKKTIRRIFDKDGKWVDTDFNSPTNNRAISNFINRAATKIAKNKFAVVKESNKDKLNRYIKDIEHLEHELQHLEKENTQEKKSSKKKAK